MRNLDRLTAACFVSGLILALTPPTFAQEKTPTAKEILARFVKVTGGKEAYAKIKSYRMKGKIQMQAGAVPVETQGTLSPSVEMYQLLDRGPAGKVEMFCLKNAAWRVSPAGPQLLSGIERSQAMREAAIVPELNPVKYYKSIRLNGTEKINGEECYKVVMTPKGGGKPEINYYSAKTGLKTKVVTTIYLGDQQIVIEALPSDYRKLPGGILRPFKSRNKLPNGDFNIVTEKVEFNKGVDKSKFIVPDDIKALVKANAKKAKPDK